MDVLGIVIELTICIVKGNFIYSFNFSASFDVNLMKLPSAVIHFFKESWLNYV